MTREVKEILIGAVAAGAFVLVFAYLYGGRDWLSAPIGGGTYALTASFNRVDGLLPGDPVHLGGIRVGAVDQQTLDSRYRAVVTIRIDSRVKLPTDTSIAIHTDGIFGSKFVVLEPGGETERLKDGDAIGYSQDAVIVSDLLDMIIAEGRANRQRSGAAPK
jgi:phospholipid/cholesterol/gamma-HCH transport system substrate-binding protein